MTRGNPIASPACQNRFLISRAFTSKIHSEPPNTPVYSYHCTQEGYWAKALPSVSQGQLSSQRRCKYSKVSQNAMNEAPASLGSFFLLQWNSTKGMLISSELTLMANSPAMNAACASDRSLAGRPK